MVFRCFAGKNNYVAVDSGGSALVWGDQPHHTKFARNKRRIKKSSQSNS
jgi:hypothetical protein